MARVVKTAEARQDEILDVAQRLFMQRGYEETPIQAIIDEVGIAKGTFYHHYPSKPALLDALVARVVNQTIALVEPLVADPNIGAIDKFNRVFADIGRWKMERKELFFEINRAARADANVLLTSKVQRDTIAAFGDLVGRIVEQGVAEGVFHTAYPVQAARMVMELSMIVGRSLGDALLAPPGARPRPEDVVRDLDALHDAMNRILGAPPGAIRLADTSTIPSLLALVEEQILGRSA